jgi:3-oxoacyl-(acyl-carrier-protein) synthase
VLAVGGVTTDENSARTDWLNHFRIDGDRTIAYCTTFGMTRIRASDVVVTGVSALTVAPGGAIAPARWAGKEARLARMDRLCALALVACDGVLVDGGLAPAGPEWDGERTAIVLGTAYGCHATNEDYYRGLVRDGTLGASPRLFTYTLPSSPLGEITIHYGIRGPALALANGLTSGVDALAEGVALVADGRADRALVCAAEVATPLLGRILAGGGGALFEPGALVDAAGALLVERTADAAARGATPRARLLGAAAAFDAQARAAAVARAVERTLAEADVRPRAVRRLIAAPTDAAVARAVGVAATDADDAAGALGAASLVALARWLAGAERETLALVCAGDDGGAGAAALVAAS